MSPSDASTETTVAAPASSASSTAPAVLPGRRGAGPYQVTMAYTGNICRSAMTEVVLRDYLATIGIPDSGPGGVTVISADVSDEERGSPTGSRVRRVLTRASYGVGAGDVLHTTGSAITSHAAHCVTNVEIIKADLLLTMTDSHWDALQCRAVGLRAEPDRTYMYHELDPVSAPQAKAVAVDKFSRSTLDVSDPWYGTMADFLDTLEVVERVGDELAEQLVVSRD